MPKKTAYQKLTDQIKIIADETGRNFFQVFANNSLGSSDADNEYGAHTLLKLSYLNYYLSIFSTIANSRKAIGGFSKVLFIDAFGGSGIVKVRNLSFPLINTTFFCP